MDYIENLPESFSSNANLNQLLVKAKSGCNIALGELLDKYRPYLMQIANDQMPPRYRSKLGGSDIVQQSFLKAGASFEQFKGESPEELTNWLAKIVINSVLSARRHFRSDKRNPDRETRINSDESNAVNKLDVPQNGSSPSKRLISDERKKHIEQALTKIPEDYQRVILMRYQDCLSFAEIGTAMDRSADAARKLWARATEAIAAQLRSMGVES